MRSQMSFLKETIEYMKTDANFVSRTDFFGEEKIARWENWLQMELLYRLKERGAEIKWEYIRSYDGRKRSRLPNQNKASAQIDVVFRPKNTDSKVRTAVELKAKLSPDQAIGGVTRDLPNRRIKTNQFPRGVWRCRL